MDKAKLLVIDDERGIREGCKRALTPQGHFVATAENGDEGLQQVRSGSFDLVLLDVMMPGTSGIDMIGMIHQVDAEIVVVIITGYATVELAVRAIKQGAYDFLTKPFTTDDLLLVVNQGLERRRLSLEARRLQDIEKEALRLEEEKKRLEELDRAKAAFMRLVTHELKAPVSAILTYLDLLLNDYVPAEEVKETLERAQARAKEELDMISDLLEFGKLKEINPRGRRSRCKWRWRCAGCCGSWMQSRQRKNLRSASMWRRDCRPCAWEPTRRRACGPTCSPTPSSTRRRGAGCRCGLSQEGEMLRGEVQDSGIGIPQAAQAKLFSEFYRAPNARELNIPGTGLGLAIVRQIIESAGGKIGVELQEGQGATFTFTLPAVSGVDRLDYPGACSKTIASSACSASCRVGVTTVQAGAMLETRLAHRAAKP